MSYDPEAYGARCDLCPLRDHRAGPPVPPEWPQRPLALFVGECPGPRETEKGRPFVGPAGMELTLALQSVGKRRDQVAITNAILCQPKGEPRGALPRFLHRLTQTNKARGARGEPLIPSPIECCRPRLLFELRALPKVVALGGTAYASITGDRSGIMKVRGGPREVQIPVGEPESSSASTGAPSLQLLPTLHPSFVLTSRRWRGALRADMSRAFRWFSSGLAWREPQGLFAPSPAQLRAFLESIKNRASVFDVETAPGFPAEEHYDPLFDTLRCFGIGTAEGTGVVVPFRSVEGSPTLYARSEQAEIVALLQSYLGPGWKKMSWNGGGYDRPVCERQLGVTPQNHLDGLLLHRLAEPELPHGLEYAGSIYTDVDKWKAGHIATSARTDAELWKYNLTDCVVTAQCIPQIAKAAVARGQDHLLPIFQRLQDICVRLHYAGLPVDQAKRREWDAKLLKAAREQKKLCQELAGRRNFNPGSVPQLRDLLFTDWEITPDAYTDLGDPSTGDDSLRKFLTSTWGLSEAQSGFIRALRSFRRVVKRRGAVVRLRPVTEPYYEGPDCAEVEETEDERERRMSRFKDRACGLVLPDGRVHSSWLCHGTDGWRISSNTPNVQNVDRKLRDMFVAPPGYLFVACDEAQLELRMVAGLAKCAYYQEQFYSGGDPHLALCEDTFGSTFRNASDEGKKELRVAVKTLTYASIYWAEIDTIHATATSAENPKTEELLFPNMTLDQVSAFHEAWLRRCPEIERWWRDTVQEWRDQGYLAEPVFGLKVDLLDGEEPNKIVNYKAQSGGAALVHKATFRFLDQEPQAKYGPGTGLIHQGHDALMCLVPEREAPRVKGLLEESMIEDGRKYGIDVPFVGEAKSGRTWKDV